MENKITTTRLAGMLSEATGRPKKLCEDFLKEIFRIVASELEQGENVRIKGFGTFKLSDIEPRKSVNVSTGEALEIPGHKRVMFVAAKELAAAVNAPFEAFEAVEVSDDVPTDILLGEYEEDDEILDKNNHIEPVPEDHSLEENTQEEVNEEPNIPEETLSGPDASEDTGAEDDNDSGLDSCTFREYEEESKNSRRRFIWGIVIGFLAAAIVAGLAVIFWGLDLIEEVSYKRGAEDAMIELAKIRSHEPTQTEETYAAAPVEDSIAVVEDTVKVVEEKDDVPTQASDTPVYDTVSTTRYLTTIAKAHYGNMDLWPVIYEENQAILGDPDRIKPGTKVIVPSLGKYNVNPDNASDIRRVKAKGREIYGRYRK